MKKNQPAENTYFDLVPFVPKVFILVFFLFCFLLLIFSLMLCGRLVTFFFSSLGLLFYFCWYKREYEGTENIRDQKDETNSTWNFPFHESGRFLLLQFFFQLECIFSYKLASKSVEWECCQSVLKKYVYNIRFFKLIFLALQVVVYTTWFTLQSSLVLSGCSH